MINADPQELAKFSELAHRWWDPDERVPRRCTRSIRCASTGSNSHVAVGRQACARRRLRRRHPGRLDGAPRRRRARHRPGDQAAEGGAAARARGRHRERRLPRGRGRGAGAEQPATLRRASPAWRCSSTCPTRHRSVRACATLVKPGGWVCSSRRINRNPKAFLFAIVGAEYVLNLLPQGHARVRALHPPERARALVPRRRPRRGTHARHGIQPADAALPAVRRHQRELPVRLPRSRHERRRRARRPCCSISTAR